MSGTQIMKPMLFLRSKLQDACQNVLNAKMVQIVVQNVHKVRIVVIMHVHNVKIKSHVKLVNKVSNWTKI